MKKIECDICKKIVNEDEAFQIRMGTITGSYTDRLGETCTECAGKLLSRFHGSKEGD